MNAIDYIISSDQAWKDQQDLDSLCRDRPLETQEPFSPNAFYGFDRVLKTYCDLPLILCYSPFRWHVYLRQTNKLVLPGASPFLYAKKVLEARYLIPCNKNENRGTLFFPAHSTHFIDTELDYRRLARAVAALPLEMRPVRVCLYWKDYLAGRAVHFQREGLEVVSAGHMFDPAVPYRLFHLCASHRFCAGNEIGSHTFYSMAAGCSYFHMQNHVPRKSADKAFPKRDTFATTAPMNRRLIPLFQNPRRFPHPRQLWAQRYFLGSDHLLPPAELRAVFDLAEELDGSWWSVSQPSGRRVTIPPSVRRDLKQLKAMAASRIPALLRPGRRH